MSSISTASQPTHWINIPPPPAKSPALGSTHLGWYLAPTGNYYFGRGKVLAVIEDNKKCEISVQVEPIPNEPGFFRDPATQEPMPDFSEPGRPVAVRRAAEIGDQRIGWYVAPDRELYRGFGTVIDSMVLGDGSVHTFITVEEGREGHYYEVIPKISVPGEAS